MMLGDYNNTYDVGHVAKGIDKRWIRKIIEWELLTEVVCSHAGPLVLREIAKNCRHYGRSVSSSILTFLSDDDEHY